MHEHGESDRPVVPAKSANKSFRDFVQELAERTEGRGLAKENAEPANRADGTQSPVGEGAAAEAAAVNLEGPQAALDRIRQAARRDTAICQPYPENRLRVIIQGKSPVR